MSHKYIRVFLLSALSCLGPKFVRGTVSNPWWSLQFHIGNEHEPYGRDCLINTGNLYCIGGFITNTKINASRSKDLTKSKQGGQFSELIREYEWNGSGLNTPILLEEPLWKKLNWVQLYEKPKRKKRGSERVRCCQSQLRTYYQHGLSFRYTSAEYLEKIINVANDGRVLNRLESKDVSVLMPRLDRFFQRLWKFID
ncbi:uncharacterized protein LOC142335924 [Convolutriloba macropyga]|uniref:uncharacterized protein LOC142335924 n=1 Tax=Convolutriloba macropyga TaxID=536237 RepID=UPI003F51BC0A